MFSKKLFCLLLSGILALGSAGAALAAEVESGSVYCFSGSDFSSEEGLTGVCITGLPDPASGTVLLGTRVVRSGDILSAAQLQKLTFQPLKTEDDTQVTIQYLPIYANRVAPQASMTISILGKEDKAPIAEDMALETYKNIPNSADLKAMDPEGEALTYTLVRQPKRGTVAISEDGSFTYTPKKNKVGTDSFTYTVTDPAGNVSRTATVTIEILKPKDKSQYADTMGDDCRFEAEWMKNSGIFVGETLGGLSCFQPEKTVTRGEFITMLVNTLGLKIEEDAITTGFTDQVPTWLKPYLAAALRSGLTENWPHGAVFGAEAPITGAEAAVLLQNALDLPRLTQELDPEVPAWAADSMAAMAEYGISLEAASMTRGEVAKALYQASKLMEDAPGMQVFGRQ